MENLSRMEFWKTKIGRIVSKPPGSDEGFTPEPISRDRRMDFSRINTWVIVCEEVLDTEHSKAYHRSARGELRRRGLSEGEIEEMRFFAWLTAGWLNFEKMLWDWAYLDVDAIYRAIEWQFRDGWILEDEREHLIAFARRYDQG